MFVEIACSYVIQPLPEVCNRINDPLWSRCFEPLPRVGVSDTSARHSCRVRRLSASEGILYSGAFARLVYHSSLLQPLDCEPERFRVRHASLNVFRRNDRREAVQQSSSAKD